MKRALLKSFVMGILGGFSFVSVAFGETLTLSECVDMALMNHRSIEQAAASRENARWALSEARRSAGPSLSWNMSGMHIGGSSYAQGRLQHDLGNGPSYDNEFAHTLSLQMTLYTGGQIEGAIDSAHYQLSAADLQLENARQTVRYRARSAYYQVLQCQSLIAVRQEAVNNIKAHLKQVENQYDVGIVARSDLLSSGVQLANQEQALVTALADHKKALASLKNIMGVSPAVELELAEDLQMVGEVPDVTDCAGYAFRHRPDALAADYNVRSAEADVRSAKSGYQPKLNMRVEKDVEGEGALYKHDHNEAWKAGVEASWNIFDNGVTSAKVKEANARLATARSQAKEVRETIELEVTEAHEDLTAAQQNIRITSDAVKKAEGNYTIAQVRYEEGVDTNLAVMDAQEKLIEARTNYYTALYNANNGKAKLDKAMGVPIAISTPLYREAIEAGKSANEALSAAEINE